VAKSNWKKGNSYYICTNIFVHLYEKTWKAVFMKFSNLFLPDTSLCLVLLIVATWTLITYSYASQDSHVG